MSEALAHQGAEEATDAVEVVDLNLVEALLRNHREDFSGMLDEEKEAFINFLITDMSKDHSPEFRVSAKRFLKEIQQQSIPD